MYGAVLWNGSTGSGFRFRRFLCKKGFSVFQYSLTAKDGSVPVSVPGKRFRRFRFRVRFLGKTVPTVPVSGSGSVPESPCRKAEGISG